MKHNLQRGFTLGDFHIRPLQGQVVGPTGTHHLHPKVIEVLLCLAGAPGELVQRDDLVREVWGGSTVGEEALTRCIGELRHALDDHRDDPRYIQTLPKRGYRLIGDLVCDHGYTEATHDPRPQGTLAALWADLKKRNVVRVAIAYSAISWVLLQFAEVMIEALKLPDWSLRVFVVLLGVGFLVSVIVAWVFQVVPEKDFEDPARRRHFMRYVEIAIIGGLATAVGLLFYRQFVDQPLFPDVARLPPEMTYPQPSEKSVAVLRLANFGGDSSFSNGLGEHLTTVLGQLRGVVVPSRTRTWQLSDQNLGPKAIARSLSVRYLLEGSVQQIKQRLRVTIQLIDGSSGNHVWSATYDEDLSAENFFNIQDLITRQVAKRLAVTLSRETEAEFAKRGTKNDEALKHYLAGREELNKPKTKSTLTASVSAFEESINSDPHYAEAHAGLCEAQLAWYVTYRDTEYFAAAEIACIRALRINKNLGEVYAALGSLHRYGGQYDDAEIELVEARRLLQDPALVLEELGRTYRAQNKLALAEQTFMEAIKKDPGNWSVYKSMGNFLFRTGRYEDALPYYKRVTIMERESAAAFTSIGAAFFMLGDFDNSTIAWRRSLNLEPTHFAYMNFGNSLYYQGRFSESVDMYRKAIELGASDSRAWGSLAASCQYAEGEQQCATDAYSKAIDLINESLSINPLDTNDLSRLAAYLARLGKREKAQETLDRLTKLNWDDPDVPFFVAQTYMALGDTRAALIELKRAVVLGYPKTLLAADPGFGGIKQDTEFIGLSQSGLK